MQVNGPVQSGEKRNPCCSLAECWSAVIVIEFLNSRGAPVKWGKVCEPPSCSEWSKKGLPPESIIASDCMHVMSHQDEMIAPHTSRCQSAPSRPGRVNALVPMPLTTSSTGLNAAKLLAVSCS